MAATGPRAATDGRGLNGTGHIVREGSLDRIAPAFRAVTDETRRQLGQQFRRHLHSAGPTGPTCSGPSPVGRRCRPVVTWTS